MHLSFLLIATAIFFIPLVVPASYRNCRIVPGDDLLYHRRIKQERTRRPFTQVASYPESLIDRQRYNGLKVINCIFCKDLLENGTSTSGSQCRIVAGGVGRTFVKFSISSDRRNGCDYDIKIYGQEI